MSAFTSPILIQNKTQSTVLERIALSSNDGDAFSEKWLQDILFANPQCLPVRDIDPHIGSLIPICTEIVTDAGPADILYVTPTGQIVLVETKLWRNSEARRTVVAQILDYAKELSSWTYEELAKRVGEASKRGPAHPLSCVKEIGGDETAFVDGINRSLKRGDFLLLIVGDGIRYGVESLVGFLEVHGNLHFTLGLIEVASFKMPDGDLLLQPRILAKTENIRRTIFLGANGDVQPDQIVDQQDADSPKNSDAPWFQTFWAEYLEALKLDDMRQPIPKPAKSTNMFFGMPPGGGSAWISAYIAQSRGKAGVFLTFFKGFDKIEDYYQRLLSQKEDIERSFGAPLIWERNGDKIYIGPADISYSTLKSGDDRKQTIQLLADMTNRMVNTFRQRLETISREIE
ncbi:MAG: DUF4268 domain-containing protein [Pseudomonadota bacterium]